LFSFKTTTAQKTIALATTKLTTTTLATRKPKTTALATTKLKTTTVAIPMTTKLKTTTVAIPMTTKTPTTTTTTGEPTINQNLRIFRNFILCQGKLVLKEEHEYPSQT
jgi:hypothetical protein